MQAVFVWPPSLLNVGRAPDGFAIKCPPGPHDQFVVLGEPGDEPVRPRIDFCQPGIHHHAFASAGPDRAYIGRKSSAWLAAEWRQDPAQALRPILRPERFSLQGLTNDYEFVRIDQHNVLLMTADDRTQ